MFLKTAFAMTTIASTGLKAKSHKIHKVKHKSSPGRNVFRNIMLEQNDSRSKLTQRFHQKYYSFL